jgi:peptide/nickel transport system permease protein
LRRLLLAIPTLLGVSLVVFALVHIAPGNPIDMLMSPETIAQMKAAYGFDKPMPRPANSAYPSSTPPLCGTS